MESYTTVEIAQSALEMAVEDGKFSTPELMNRVNHQISHSEAENILAHLQEFGWIQKSGENNSLWMKGPSGIKYLKSPRTEDYPLRVLPDEVPKEEDHR